MKKTMLFLLIMLMPVLTLANSSNIQKDGYAEASYNICGVVIDTATSRTLAGVTITDGASISVVTGANGLYTVTVDSGWSGTLTPVLPGYTFSPGNRTYDSVRESFNSQNYDATPITFTISGNIADISGNPLADAIINYDGGSASTDSSGDYSIIVSWNWSGTITPYHPGVEFTPTDRTYSNVLADFIDQDFVSRFVPSFTITASAGAGGSISPAGKTVVNEDGSLSLLMNPSDGYKISNVIVDGKSVGTVSSYTFKRVKDDHFIRVNFTPAAYGWLKVIIVPGQAIEAGAVWRIKGTIQWLPSSAKLELPPGTYEIEFRDLPDWTNCCLEGAVVYAGQTTIVDDVCYKQQDGGAKVRYFVADDYSTSPVTGSTLRWYVEGTEEVSLSFVGEVVAVGDTKVNPSSNSNYWLLANDLNGTVSAGLELDVHEKPLIDWFTTDAGESNPGRPGDEAQLSWRIHGAESVEVFAVDAYGRTVKVAGNSGEVTVTPAKTSLYRLVAENSAGESVADVFVNVTDKPVIREFTADDYSLISGQSTRLRWTVKGADSVEIQQIGSNLKSKGKKLVTPGSDVKYILIAENSAGSVSQEVEINVSNAGSDLFLQIEKVLFDGMEVTKAYLGSELEAVITLVNNGTEDAKSFDVTIVDSKGELARKTIKILAAGAVKTIRIKFIAMNSGDMGLTAIADEAGVLFENILADNEAVSGFTGIIPPMPEIVLADIDFALVDAMNGKGVEISFQIKNVGNKKAQNFQIDLDVNGQRVFWEAVKSISKGKTLSYKTTAMIGKDKKFKVTFTVDRYEVVGELNRDNNVWYQKIATRTIK